jgi:nicotinate phosphoribosyltransferase
MSFDSELEAFDAYAAALPNNCVFLVDTYDTLEGVRHAVEVGRRLRARGHEMVGVRLDSGDLLALSGSARAILDDAGFPDAVVVASNDLDEHAIASLRRDGAAIAVWGVGTKLATAYDDPALGGVYKLAALRRAAGDPWQLKAKRSEQAIKASNPGALQIRRFRTHGGALVRDVLYDALTGWVDPAEVVDLVDPARIEPVPADGAWDDLLRPVLRGGRTVAAPEPLAAARARAAASVAALPAELQALEGAARFPVGLERRLHERKTALLEQAVATGREKA